LIHVVIAIFKYIKNCKISKYETARFLFIVFLTLIMLCLVFTSPLLTINYATLFSTLTQIVIKWLPAPKRVLAIIWCF